MRYFIILIATLFAGGCALPSFVVRPVPDLDLTDLEEANVQDGKGLWPKKIVIIPVEGLIMNAREPSLMGGSENPVSLLSQQLAKAADDPRVAAIVLRISSPGSTVTSGDTVHQLVREFKRKTGKPVIASCQEVAASGGYYIALAADEIVARPSTVVGSIGAILTTFDIEGTLGKIGARTYTIKTGRFKDMASPFKPMAPEERQLLQQMLEQYASDFRKLVQDRRKLSAEELAAVSDGRVFTGEQARALKLIDRIGSLEEAVDIARQRAGVEGAKAVLYIRPYGYGGSIYSSTAVPSPEARKMELALPMAGEVLPSGFYYLWRP